MIKNWKLKLRYGKISTAFKHYTVLADGEVGELGHGFACRPGKAWMAMKIWANSMDESVEMIQSIGAEIGFEVTGKIEVYETDPTAPPSDKPFGYGINFTPYDE